MSYGSNSRQSSRGGSICNFQGCRYRLPKSKYGSTALLVAAGHADPAIVQLLENGADPNVKKPQNPQLRYRSTETSLLQAARNADNSEAIIRLLLDHGAIPHGPDDYQALLLLIERGHVSLFRLLVDHGAPLEHELTRAPTLMRTALLSRQKMIVDQLLEMGMTPRKRDLEIVRNINPEALRMLQSRQER
jgi:ankyrin repeat protein